MICRGLGRRFRIEKFRSRVERCTVVRLNGDLELIYEREEDM
jgi:hypothetical protein